jgi:hypothetical protein
VFPTGTETGQSVKLFNALADLKLEGGSSQLKIQGRLTE